MIPRISGNLQRSRWQAELAEAVREPVDLLRLLDLPLSLLAAAELAHRQFPLRVPLAFMRRMRRGDPHDPLLQQVLPIGRELEQVAGFVSDPVGDHTAHRGHGVLQKYAGRQLIVATGACAVHCRYCFRRHFPYSQAMPRGDGWQQVLNQIGEQVDVNEIILSGGDPLNLGDDRLAEFAQGLLAHRHVRTLRLHTRLPVVLPSRIDEGFLDWFTPLPLNKVVVLHINHPQEIDAELVDAIAHLKHAGATLLNQSVLLRGINDDAAVLTALSRALFEAGVLPYYLHQLDKVAGAAHFAVDDARAADLVRQVREQLPGYLVPRLVVEQAGQPSKTPLT